VRAVANRGLEGLPPRAGELMPEARALYLRTRALHGPWVDAWRARSVDGEYGEQIARLGVLAAAYVPLRDELGVMGLLILDTTTLEAAERFAERLPSFLALGTVASTHLAMTLGDRSPSTQGGPSGANGAVA
jgi:hypothetical protein